MSRKVDFINDPIEVAKYALYDIIDADYIQANAKVRVEKMERNSWNRVFNMSLAKETKDIRGATEAECCANERELRRLVMKAYVAGMETMKNKIKEIK